MEYVTEHFTKNELACSLTGLVRFHDGFLDELEELRETYGKPMRGNSGCRSYGNQMIINPSAPNSYHIYDITADGRNGALAIDIGVPYGKDRGDLVSKAWAKGWSVIVYSTFIHLDKRTMVGAKQYFGYGGK